MTVTDIRKSLNILNENYVGEELQEKPRIAITYEIITPESAEQGDAAEHGWIDEEGVDMDVDQYDRDDGITSVDKAIEFLQNEGATEASSSHFDDRVWYNTSDGNQNYRTGETEFRSYHLRGFSTEEKQKIFQGML